MNSRYLPVCPFAILLGTCNYPRSWFTPGYVLPSVRTPSTRLPTPSCTTRLAQSYIWSFRFCLAWAFAVQISRAEAKGVTGKSLYIRRMLGLFVIGCLHYILVWDGDILRVYAIFGVVLLFLNKLPNRGLWIGALLLMLASPVVTIAMEQIHIFDTASSGDVLAQIRDIYNNGSYPEVVAYRLNNFLPDLWAYLTFDGFNIMAMFMLGMYAGRRKIFENLDTYRILFIVGLVGGILAALAGYFTRIDLLHRPGMAMIHVSAITLLAMNPWFGKKLSILIPFGRMSFTNYISQSIIATTIFYGYGFGQFEKIGLSPAC